MTILVPNYYHQFRCIADKCTHNCCIGWEIDIDEETLRYYDRLEGDFGDRIRQSISRDEQPHFALKEGERCPFLNRAGLCDMISTLGENALCNICTDHPRFRNFYSRVTEMGLGLCCEEAARVMLGAQQPFALVALGEEKNFFEMEEEESSFFEYRNTLFSLMQNRDLSIGARFFRLAKMCGFEFGSFSLKSLCDIYRSLERLDSAWDSWLEELNAFEFDVEFFENTNLQVAFEQLCCYFIFRHLPEAMRDGDYAARIRFSLTSCYMIGALCALHQSRYEEVTIENMAEYARMYSAEVEYSDENMITIFELI